MAEIESADRRTALRGLLGAASAATLLWSPAARAQRGATSGDAEYVLTTGPAGSEAYAVGLAVATLSKLKLQPRHGFGLSAALSSGSDENAARLRNNDAQFAILSGPAVVAPAPVADGAPAEVAFRSVAALWRRDGSTKGAATFRARRDVLAARADVRAEHVYRLCRGIFENAAFIAEIDPAMAALSPDTGLRGLTRPLHPGAARFFKEAGLEIAPELVAP